MPIFTYRCSNGHEWDERRKRDDPMLDRSQAICGCCEYPSIGYRVFSPTTTVYYHGTGWSKKDRINGND